MKTRRAIAGALLLAAAISPSLATPASAVTPAPATFTPNVPADAGYLNPDGTRKSGADEPQVAVDETGMTYITWQSSSRMSRTRDGVHFDFLGDPDASGVNDSGDVAIATTTWPSPTQTLPVGPKGSSAVMWSHLGPVVSCPGGPINIRAATSEDQGRTWSAKDASCNPAQTDRNWMAAYTPPQFRDTPDAVKNTVEYQIYHDFGISGMWLVRSLDGGASWDLVQHNTVDPTSSQAAGSLNNSIPGGVAVDQRGKHPGRVFVEWSTSDVTANILEGGNLTQAEPFDHIFLSYSDDQGTTWHSTTVFNDPCSPDPPRTPPNPLSNNCQDVSELFTPLAVDDAGNPYVAFIWRDIRQTQPEYDLYIARSLDGGATFGAPVRVPTDPSLHTHYMPWITAGSNGMVDVVYYATTYLQGVGNNGKPGAAPRTALWNVYMSQTLDGGQTWSNAKVSDHINYFGDICSVGIFCNAAAAQVLNTGPDRVLLDDFGVAIGPDGGARVAWTDTRESMTGTCTPEGAGDIKQCQSLQRHVYFACQNGGTGLHGEAVTGCGQPLNLGVRRAAVSNPVLPAISKLPPLPSTAAISPLAARLPLLAVVLLGGAASLWFVFLVGRPGTSRPRRR